MNTRFVAVLTVFILTFILHLSFKERAEALHLSLGVHAEATLAPDAAPAFTQMTEAPSEPLLPIQHIDTHEHDDHEVVVTELFNLPLGESFYAHPALESVIQFDAYPYKRPPRRA